MTVEEQDQNIDQIVEYLEQVSKTFHTSPHKLLLDYGIRCYSNEQSFQGPKGPPKQCFMNAYQAMLGDSSLTYVEGYYINEGVPFPFEHAWCIDKEGWVVEPTSERVLAYYGIPFNRTYVLRTALRTGVYGIISDSNRPLLLGRVAPAKFRAATPQQHPRSAAAFGASSSL